MTCSIDKSANYPEAGGQATMTWSGPGGENQGTGVTELTLELGVFNSNKSGEYQCTASNIRGTAKPESVYVSGE